MQWLHYIVGERRRGPTTIENCYKNHKAIIIIITGEWKIDGNGPLKVTP